MASRRMTAAYGLACVAGLGRTLAQNTEIVLKASTNEGQTWASAVSALAGTTVYVRMRVRLANAGTNTVLGLAGVTCQPTLTNWNPSVDVREPFTDPWNGVTDKPQTNTGRVFPFSSSGMPPEGRPISSHNDPGNVLRFANTLNVTMTTNLAWGISTGQVPPSIGGTNFRAGTHAVVFRYAVTLGNAGPRDLIASVPYESILQRRGSWYRAASGSGSLFAPVDSDASGIFPAVIHVVPGTGVVGVVACGVGLAAVRRRRST